MQLRQGPLILFIAEAVIVRSGPLQDFFNTERKGQSPIDITTYQNTYCPDLAYQIGFDSKTPAKLENTGHTVRVMIEGTQPVLTGGPLTSSYTLQEVHFHWGKDDSEGSEHTRNGIRYPMETHVVHYKTKYGSFAEASKQPDGLAIMGIVFEITPFRFAQGFLRYLDNQLLQPLSSHLQNVPAANQSIELDATSLLQWLWPYITPTNYFTYSGSLTTPPYSEVAIWMVYNTVIRMSENQIDEFRKLIPEGNFRQTQPLNGREVTFCKPHRPRRFLWPFIQFKK